MQLAYTTTAKNITSSISATALFTVSLTLTQSALAASKRKNTYLYEAELYRWLPPPGPDKWGSKPREDQ